MILLAFIVFQKSRVRQEAGWKKFSSHCGKINFYLVTVQVQKVQPPIHCAMEYNTSAAAGWAGAHTYTFYFKHILLSDTQNMGTLLMVAFMMHDCSFISINTHISDSRVHVKNTTRDMR
jgi:hypothetical protein